MAISSRILSAAHLKAIGLVAAEWSYVESSLQQLIWHVASVDNERGYCITTHVGSETRINILESLADKRLPSPSLKTRLKSVIAKIRTLRAERNNIVHSIWVSNGMPDFGLQRSNRGRKPTPHSIKITAKGVLRFTQTPYPSKKMLDIANDITTLALEMYVLLEDMKREQSRPRSLAELVQGTLSPVQYPGPMPTKRPRLPPPARA